MRIESITLFPLAQIPFLCAASSHKGIEQRMLPVLKAEVDCLPSGLEALAAMSDLQGVSVCEQRLIGFRVAELLLELAKAGSLPAPKTMGIILAGDLWARVDVRGGYGDVRGIWQEMAACFRWVVGIAGNHDLFGNTLQEIEAFKDLPSIYYLDEDVVKIDGISIAGISGVIGRPTKPFRRKEKDFIQATSRLIKRLPQILILHESPEEKNLGLPGRESIRKVLVNAKELLVICGHSHWSQPMTTLTKGVQVLNVDSRVVILVGKNKD